MGGTSTDVAPVLGGEASTTTESVVAGVPIKLPMVDVHTVSAGGGSIAWADPGGALRVGPRSAGADPGPGGLRQGRRGADGDRRQPAARLPRRRRRARRRADARRAARRGGARRRSASELGLDALETALGVVRVANAEMGRALRVISVERGLDPRDFALVAFGGAGGLHACALAEELGIPARARPARRRRAERARPRDRPTCAATTCARCCASASATPRTPFAAMEEQAREDLEEPELRRRADLRYRGQSFELTRRGRRPRRARRALRTRRTSGATATGWRARSRRARQRARDRDRAGRASPSCCRGRADGDADAGTRRANFDGDWSRGRRCSTARRMGARLAVEGPAIVEFAEATCVVRPGWCGRGRRRRHAGAGARVSAS